MDVAKHLQSLYSPPSSDRKLIVNKDKSHINPYFDVWAWSNQNVEWAGPEPGTVRIKQSHAILPILYHHFGCVCPSYEALSLISQLSRARTIVDLGSGNGYWTYMLRRQEQGKKKLNIIPVDNGMSEWRTMWIPDTVEMEGAKWLNQHSGAKDAMLLLVYPNTGEDFTSKMIKAYRKFKAPLDIFSCLLPLLTFRYRWHDDHRCKLAKRFRVHCFREGDNFKLDGERDVRLGENIADTPSELRRQR